KLRCRALGRTIPIVGDPLTTRFHRSPGACWGPNRTRSCPSLASRLKHPMERSDTSTEMYATAIMCDDCRLTPAAAALLTQVLRGLRRDRPDDTRWGADVCSSCGEVT